MPVRCVYDSEREQLMEKVTIKIDGQDFSVPKNTTILEAALGNNIYIPHLCYHPDLKPVGNCRICLVELDNGRIVTSCRTIVREGMALKTDSPEVDKVRRPVVEMLIANHHMDCRSCGKKGNCALQKIRAKSKIDKKRLERLRVPKEKLPVDTSNPFFEKNPNKCVLCGICIRTCKDIQKVSAINFAGRGHTARVSPFKDTLIVQSRCESCGECVVRCPVGALVVKNFKRPKDEFRSVCPYCSVGCGIYLGTRDNVLVNIRGNSKNPVNKGQLCVKGRFGWSFVNSTERLTSPLIKQNGKFIKATWDEALELIVSKFKNYKREEFALLASAKSTNEDSYIAQKFARVVTGSNNIDSSARLCHASSINAIYETTRRMAIASSMDEIEQSACIIVAGTNITRTHPVAGIRIKKAVENGAKLILISPNETDLCSFAKVWLRPYPATDAALLMGMCGVIVDEGLFDESFIKERCDNFEDFKASIDNFTLGRVEKITGIERDTIVEAAKLYATMKPASILWSTGITQHPDGTDIVHGFVNLSILTGKIVQPSSGLSPLWRQNNALGACDMGCLPDFYPGYQSVTSPEVQKKFESSWGRRLNPEPGLTFTETIQATLNGKVKTLYIIGSDPASRITHQKVKEALKRAEFIVLQDIFLNETSKFAHVVLPAASFAEKDGTFTNTERRVQRIHKAIEPVKSSKPDWHILCDIAKKSGFKGFDFTCTEEIMSEISSLTPLYKNVSYSALNKVTMQLTSPDEEKTQVRFKFTPLKYKTPSEKADIDFPLILISEMDIYSAGSLSRRVEGLNSLSAKGLVYLNQKDAMDFEIENDKMVKVISRYGEIEGKAKITDISPPGIVAMSLTEEDTHLLINSSQEQITEYSETKVCAVRIVPLYESPTKGVPS